MHFLMYLLAVALQAPDSGAFVITLGKDTIGMERYTRTADRLVDDMVMRDRAPVISRHFVATLGADGLISHIELDNKPVVASAVPPIHAVGRYTKDEAFVDLTRNGQTTTAHVATPDGRGALRSEEHTSELQSRLHLVCRLLLEKKKKKNNKHDDSQRSTDLEAPAQQRTTERTDLSQQIGCTSAQRSDDHRNPEQYETL